MSTDGQKCGAQSKGWGRTTLTLLCTFSFPTGCLCSPIKCKSFKWHLMGFAFGSAVMHIWHIYISTWILFLSSNQNRTLMLNIHGKKKVITPSTANKYIPFNLGQPKKQSPLESKVGLSARMVGFCSCRCCSFERKIPEAISEAWWTLCLLFKRHSTESCDN